MFQQDAIGLVMKPTRRAVYHPSHLNDVLDGTTILKAREEEVILPVGLTVICVGFSTDQYDRRVGVFLIVASQLGNEVVKEFGRQYENWVFLMSEEKQAERLKEV